MSILLSRMCVVPTWFVVVGLVALSSPPIVPQGVLLLGAAVATSAVIITFVLRRGLNGAGAMDIQRMWHRGATIERRSVLTAMHRTSCGWTVTRDEALQAGGDPLCVLECSYTSVHGRAPTAVAW